jgi:heptosyltransferase-1
MPSEMASFPLKIGDRDAQSIANLLDQPHLKKSNVVLVCPGSQWSNKQLPLATLIAFLQRLEQEWQASFLITWGTEKEKQLAESVYQAFPATSWVCDKWTLPALQHLMSQVALVLAMDSLPLHLAGTTKTPTYSIFGPSSSKKYKPLGNHHEAFQGRCPYDKAFEKRCALLRTCQTGACMKDISAEELYNHFKEWWTFQTCPSFEGKLLPFLPH